MSRTIYYYEIKYSWIVACYVVKRKSTTGRIPNKPNIFSNRDEAERECDILNEDL